MNKDEIKIEVENTIANFIDLARQMECFFLQKRFQLSCLKPELLLKEENIDLRHEIARKDELLKKHSTKIVKWKEYLSDTSAAPAVNPQSPMNPTQLPPYPQMHGSMVPGQQPLMGPSMAPQQNIPPQMHQAGFGTHRPLMQNPNNPLAFLEKTTNNIDMGGPSRV